MSARHAFSRALPTAPSALRARRVNRRWRGGMPARKRAELRRAAQVANTFVGGRTSAATAAASASSAAAPAAADALLRAGGWDAAWDRPRRATVPRPRKALELWRARKVERNAMIAQKVSEADDLLAKQRKLDNVEEVDEDQYFEWQLHKLGVRFWDAAKDFNPDDLKRSDV